MLRIVLAAAFVLASAGAYAQFNKCGYGFCPNGFPGPGVTAAGGSASPSCANDAPDGNIDLSKCSNAIYTAAIL
jgi:hypothetical protein